MRPSPVRPVSLRRHAPAYPLAFLPLVVGAVGLIGCLTAR